MSSPALQPVLAYIGPGVAFAEVATPWWVWVLCWASIALLLVLSPLMARLSSRNDDGSH